MGLIKSQEELYQDFITELQNQAPELSDLADGSMIDILAGVMSSAVSELSRLAVDEFRKTMLDTAHGPEITGGPDDLQTLAVDHFGAAFARPEATYASGIVTFSRPNDEAGDCVIPAGTIVKTLPNANGEAQRFETEVEVTLTGTSINATVNALEAGTDGNVLEDTVVEIEGALTDATVSVSNENPFVGGEEEENDSEYRETIRNKIISLTGATLSAIQAAALEVAGVEAATAIENEMVVVEYDIGESAPVEDAQYFRIPKVVLYIADANGEADQALVDDVKEAIAPVRAAGVRVDVLGATALALDWTGNISLNPFGPNYATLSVDAQPIIDTMVGYLQDLAIGQDFDRDDANAAILAIWGPDGTDDLTSFSTSVPSGDVDIDENQKIVPGDVGLS